MSVERKFWPLPASFRRLSGKQNLPLKVGAGRAGSRTSSVYLSDDSATGGFVIVPEFDEPVRTETPVESNHASRLNLPAVTSPDSLSSNDVDDYLYDFKSIGSQHSSHIGGDSLDASVARDDDLTQRLCAAYDHIRSMPSATSPEAFLSSDPQMLRKQLGVPQHSVLNYPISSSLDLPNPHTYPRQSTSPTLPPATSLDMSHSRASKGLGLGANTDIYPLSPRHRFPDHFQPVQKKSMVTAPTLSEKTLSECRTLGRSWNAHVRTSQPQHRISNTSKHVKRRVEKPIVLPSSLLSLPRRQVLRGVLRKPVADTSPSDNAPRWQTSLPQVRSPSPFTIDIPLHHAWHDRRTDFNSHEYHSRKVHVHEKKLRRTSGNTDILASLAWIGASPTARSPCPANREHQSTSPAFFSDQLSMAMAVEDDSISDDVLVDQLEKVRRTSGPFEQGSDIFPSRSPDNAHCRGVGEDINGFLHTSCSSAPPQTRGQFVEPCDVPQPSLIMSKATTSSDDAAVWQAARKTLLCVREIIRTEKKYQEALKMLLNAQTATPPPPSMAPYVSALVRASETLLKCFLEDPSAWGVSTAFVTSEDELEATMVSWCAVAGGFFTDENDRQPSGSTGKRRLRTPGMMLSSSPSVMKQASDFSAPRLSLMFFMTSITSRTKGRTDEENRAMQHLQTPQERKTASGPLQNSESVTRQTPSRKLSVRDLAIQPIQRVMRYVLLYRDLLHCTPPTSPSRLLVERALEAATRIADRCDGAQRNPAFCHV